VNAAVDPDVVGTWLATTGNPAGVTAVFSEEGTFTWSNGDVSGTYEADGSTLTFQFSADGAFCPGETLIWNYAVTNDELTSDVVGGQCGGEQGPPSPDWIFERQ
jgi:hypothetical protein